MAHKNTIYQATIPPLTGSVHLTAHTTKRAAIKALKEAETYHKQSGQVERIATHKVVQFRQVVYPVVGVTQIIGG